MNVGRLCKALLARRGLPVLAVAVLSFSLGFASGFVVDDALVVARFAWVVRTSGRHAFALGGPTVDGVTPLPYPWLVAPFARSVLAALSAQRMLGALALVAGVTGLALRLARISGTRSGALLGVLVVASSFPLAVHASSGLETGLATGLVAAALAFGVGETEGDLSSSALLFGFACTLRPELLPAAFVAVVVRLTHATAVAQVARVAGPSLAVFAVRGLVFGSPVPLAVLAKPSDLRHGAVYVGAGLLVTGLFALVFAAFPALRASEALRPARRSALALAGVHAVVVAAVGGDWMPYARLLVPVVPALAVFVASVSASWGRVGVVVVTLGANLALGWRHRDVASGVASTREHVIAELAPQLARCARVAGLDAGFLGAAFPGPIVDLAGLTDPTVAALRGGHTSKALPEGFLDARGVDAFVLWAPPGSVVELGPAALFGRVVETRLARSPAVRVSFTEYARVPWDARGAELVVFRRSASIR